MRPRDGREGLAWLALAVALSPALRDWAGHLAAEPQVRHVLVAPVLLLWAGLQRPDRERPRRDGLVLLMLAVLVQWLALLAGPASLGRLALPVGICGLARWLGRPVLPVALLSLWMVPLPHRLAVIASPELEHGLLQAAAWPVRLLGLDVSVSGAVATFPDGHLQLKPIEALVAVHVLSAVAWFGAVRGRRNAFGALRAACLGAALGVPVQAFAVTVALLGSALGAAETSQVALRLGFWPILFGLATPVVVKRNPAR